MRSISITQTRVYEGYSQAYDGLVHAYQTGDQILIEKAKEKFHRHAPSNIYLIVTERLDNSKNKSSP